MLKQTLQPLSPQPVLGFPNVHNSRSSAQPLLPELTNFSKISPPGRQYRYSINHVTHAVIADLFACQYIGHGITTPPPDGVPVMSVTIKEHPTNNPWRWVSPAFAATHGSYVIRTPP